MDDYITTCPNCWRQLEVVAFEFYGRIPLESGGFVLGEAIESSTTEEKVECPNCKLSFYGLPQGSGWFVKVVADVRQYNHEARETRQKLSFTAYAVDTVGDYWNDDHTLSVEYAEFWYDDMSGYKLLETAQVFASVLKGKEDVVGIQVVDHATPEGVEKQRLAQMKALEELSKMEWD
jgi:hypothetical protein